MSKCDGILELWFEPGSGKSKSEPRFPSNFMFFHEHGEKPLGRTDYECLPPICCGKAGKPCNANGRFCQSRQVYCRICVPNN